MTVSYELGHCPACGDQRAETLADAEELRSEVEAMWEFQLARRAASVPTKQLFDRAFFSQHAPLRIARCASCGTLYRDPRESALELSELYGSEEPDEGVLEELLGAQRGTYQAQARRLTRIARRPGTGLEVGSYVGGFLAAAREAGWTMTGVDVNQTANAFARAHGFTVLCGTLEDAPRGPFDAIAIWNCFDQLPDPRGTLRAAHERLRAGGVLALRVPNGGCYARLRTHRSARRLLAWNNLLGFPYRHGFTGRSLSRLLEAEQYRVVKMKGDALPKASDRWTRAWAKQEETLVKGIARIASARYAPWIEGYAIST